MDNTSLLESKIREETLNGNELYARLRRLKIQEEILTAASNKCLRKCIADDIESSRYTEEQDLKKYINKMKKEFGEIKNLFEDVKVITQDQENLKNTDIDEIKRDIFDLDEKIKNFKDFILKETSILKVAEKEIHKQINENEYTKQNTLMRAHSKPHYNEVVPSPVRAIINSPFKCAEVQRFQEFMKNSCNRYGGWDEYNHNIFVGVWNKHFSSEDILSKASIFEETSYFAFQDEVMNKIFGIKSEDVKSHADWYFEYTKLKKCQEFALNKWRENKRKIKKPKQIVKADDQQLNGDTKKSLSKCKRNGSNSKERNDKSSSVAELFSKLNIGDDSTEVLDVHFITNNEKDSNVFKRKCLYKREEENSTLQKPVKYYGFKDDIQFIDSVKKLKTPTWRINLK